MWLETLGTAALAATLPGSAYLATLTAAATRPARQVATLPATQPRLVIVVPAHNESQGLQATLRSLQREVAADRQTHTQTRLVVVADNCSDDTADVARAAGVQVLERHDSERRGKGHALRHAFELLQEAEAFIVVDADTEVEPGFLPAMRQALAGGAAAAQCRYGVREPLACRSATLADVALGAWNVLRPRGRAALGLSTGILGNGFALSRRVLQAVPYTASSIVEDVEYHHMLVKAGFRVDWVDQAQVRGDMPRGRHAAQQRARWEGGRLRLLFSQGPALAARMLAGQWRLADPLLDLLLWPLAWHVSLLLLALALSAGAVQAAAGAGLLIVGLHVAVALALMPARREHLLALLGAPAYVIWKICLARLTWAAASRHAPWVRSTRRPS